MAKPPKSFIRPTKRVTYQFLLDPKAEILVISKSWTKPDNNPDNNPDAGTGNGNKNEGSFMTFHRQDI